MQSATFITNEILHKICDETADVEVTGYVNTMPNLPPLPLVEMTEDEMYEFVRTFRFN